jgi:two-component system nitrate/nitrite response regulator NarL
MGQPLERSAVLLDEHPLWLDALEGVIQRAEICLVGKFTRPSDAVACIEERGAALLVFDPDVRDGELDGLECFRKARETAHDLKAVAVAASEDPRDVEAVLGAGVFAYALKRAHPDDLAAALRQAFDSSIYLAAAHGGSALGSADAAASAGLTRREAEILCYVAEGSSNKEVARALWVTEQTVKFHLANVFRKLQVANRTQAGRWAHAHGLLEGNAQRRQFVQAAPLAR